MTTPHTPQQTNQPPRTRKPAAPLVTALLAAVNAFAEAYVDELTVTVRPDRRVKKVHNRAAKPIVFDDSSRVAKPRPRQ